MLADIDMVLVNRWLNDPKEKPEDIGETVGLMLQVLAGLTGEIDVFIGSVDTSQSKDETAASPLPAEEETEMVDLVTDEPVASLLRLETPFEFTSSSR
jgi:hypothetical protein